MRRALAGFAAALAMTAPASAAAEPPVWIVRDADSEMVLFGSVHVLPPGLDWRPASLERALARADDVWFELPVTPQAEQEVAHLAASLGVLPPDKSLFAMLPKAEAARLARVAVALGADRAALDRLEPWLAEVMLGAAAYRRAGANAADGVEKALSAAAPTGARRRALETPAEQIGIFDRGPFAEQLASLAETVRELDEDPDAYRELIAAWLAGDVDALDRQALEPMRKATPGLFRRLVTERNARWAQELDARLKGHGRSVVVVGVGHLVGEGGLPERLRALGYSVSGP